MRANTRNSSVLLYTLGVLAATWIPAEQEQLQGSTSASMSLHSRHATHSSSPAAAASHRQRLQPCRSFLSSLFGGRYVVCANVPGWPLLSSQIAAIHTICNATCPAQDQQPATRQLRARADSLATQSAHAGRQAPAQGGASAAARPGARTSSHQANQCRRTRPRGARFPGVVPIQGSSG